MIPGRMMVRKGLTMATRCVLLTGAAALALLVGGQTTAWAQDREEGGFYVSARGGFNWNEGQRLVGQRNDFLARDDTHNGWAVGGAIGYDLNPLRFEIEYLHRNNDLQIVTVTNDGGLAGELGLRVAAGHGLDYPNVAPVAAIPEVEELNIGHAIIARAIFCGMDRAVRDMLAAMGAG